MGRDAYTDNDMTAVEVMHNTGGSADCNSRKNRPKKLMQTHVNGRFYCKIDFEKIYWQVPLPNLFLGPL